MSTALPIYKRPPPTLPMRHQEALDWYVKCQVEAHQRGGDAELLRIRTWLDKNDLFFLLIDTLHRPDVNDPWIFERCRDVQIDPDGKLDLWAREHYKSTIITFALTIQDILNDPEVTFGIFSHTRPAAKKFLRPIKQEFEINTDLKLQHSDVLYDRPHVESPKWSEDEGIIVKRVGIMREATVEAWGLLDGMPTGSHFKKRVYDDIVTDKTVTSAEMINKLRTQWELSDNLGARGGVARYAATKYAMGDLNLTITERGAAEPRMFPCTTDGSEDFSKSVLMSAEELARKRAVQGPYTFGAQMNLNPTADKAQGFKDEWLRYWPARSFHALNFILIVDPASTKKFKERGHDYTQMWVIGIGADKKIRICDGVRDRLNLQGRTNALFALHRQWRPSVTGYEEYGLQADIEHMESVMQLENYNFDITPLGGPTAKLDRIKGLQPDAENGNILWPEMGLIRTNYEGKAIDIVRQCIEEEWKTFPLCSHFDGLDCLARIKDPAVGARPFETPPRDNNLDNFMPDEALAMIGGDVQSGAAVPWTVF